jgi:biopolymer transport protein ExbB/TolQ
MSIEQLIFDLADALLYPVLVLAVLALFAALVEAGMLIAELLRRRERSVRRLEEITNATRRTLATGDVPGAVAIARTAGYSAAMNEALTAIVELRGDPDGTDRIAKRLADYDYTSMKRLERTRILVRLGPALGLMGTLIPLSPALAGLAKGNVDQLTHDLRVAFSVTVIGLLTGAIAFTASLVRERVYAQDYSDVEFLAVRVAEPLPPVAAAPVPPTPPAIPPTPPQHVAPHVAPPGA